MAKRQKRAKRRASARLSFGYHPTQHAGMARAAMREASRNVAAGERLATIGACKPAMGLLVKAAEAVARAKLNARQATHADYLQDEAESADKQLNHALSRYRKSCFVRS